MSRRVRITVRWRGNRNIWQVKRGRTAVYGSSSKTKAVREARSIGRGILLVGGLSQVVVFGQKGRIQFENTYGKDPRRHKG
jgi:hypothetical protein